MKTRLLLWVMLMLFSFGNGQQITLDTSDTANESGGNLPQGTIEDFWYWSWGFKVQGQGFHPNSTITIFATDPSGKRWRDFQGTADANGKFSIQISAKNLYSLLGAYVIKATDASGSTANANLTVIRHLRATLNSSTTPKQVTQAQFNETGVKIASSGLGSNSQVRVNISSPNSSAEISPNDIKYADANGNFEMFINTFTPTVPWGDEMPQVPGKWIISVSDWSTPHTPYGLTDFRLLPNNPSKNNYCTIEQVNNATGTIGVYPITSFEIVGAGAAHTSPVTSDSYYEDFTQTVLNVNAGQTYTVRLKGKNHSTYAADTYTLFVDWNQNGILDEDNEIIQEGFIFNSTGEDDKLTEFQIKVPENALSGETRLRILKVESATTYAMYWPTGACGYFSNNGQAEDYTLNITGGIVLPNCELTCPGNINTQADQGTNSKVVNYVINKSCQNTTGNCEVNYPGSKETFLPIATPIVANDFIIPAGTSASVTKITANIVRAMFSASANIYLYSDNQGQPGDLIKSFTNVPYSSRTEVGSIGGFPVYESVWNLPSSVDLPSGKYWLGLNVGGPLIYWETTSTISGETAYTTFNSGTTWQKNGGHDGVFRISYECSQNPANDTEIVLVEGLTSGSAFPIGTTKVTHNLVYQGHVIDTCSFDVKVEEFMSVADMSKTKLSFYPNPVKDILHISAGEKIGTIRVFDVSGRKVSDFKLNEVNPTINLSHLPNGVYTLSAEMDNSIKNFKVIKK